MGSLNDQQVSAKQLFVKRLVAGSAGVLAFPHLFVPGFRVDTVGLLLIVIALSPWLIPFVRQYVKSGEVFGLRFELLQKTVENQGEQTKRQWNTISKQQEIEPAHKSPNPRAING